MTDNVGEKTFSHNEWSSSENTMICVKYFGDAQVNAAEFSGPIG